MVFRCLLLLILVTGLKAQKLRFDRFTPSEGLLSDDVFNLQQDNKGFLWLFTNYGALKYDGKEFTKTLLNLGIGEAFVYSSYHHPSGRMWIATSRANIYEVVNDSVFRVAGTESVSEELRRSINEILSIRVDDSLNIFAITKHHSYKFFPTPTGYRSHCLSAGPSDSITFRIIEKEDFILGINNFTGNDSVFCGGNDEIRMNIQLKDDTGYCVLECKNAHVRHVKKFGKDLLLAHDRYLYKYKNGKMKTISIPGYILNFTRDARKHTWVATYRNGLCELDENDSIVNNYFKDITVHDVFLDSQKGMWVSTSGRGLFHAGDLNHKHFVSPHDLSNPVVILKNVSNGMLAGTSSGDLYLFSDDNSPPQKIYGSGKEELLDALEHRGKYYLLFRHSLLELDRTERKEKRRFSFSPSGNRLVVLNDTLYIIHPKKMSYLAGGKISAWRYFRHRIFACATQGGKFVAALEDGVHVLGGPTGTDSVLPFLKQIRIRKFTEGPGERLLLSSLGHGIFELDSQRVIGSVRKTDGLPTNIVNGVSLGRTGVLVSTNEGLFYCPGGNQRLTDCNWEKVYGGNVNEAMFYGEKIYAATVNGLVVLDLKQIRQPEKVRFYLNDFKVNGKKKNIKTPISLEPHENNIEISFDLITFTKVRPEINYKLFGPYRDSGIVQANILKFSHLPPGKYTLISTPAGLSGESLKIKREFSIAPAFWQTRTFILMVFLFVLILVLGGGFLVGNYYRRKRDKRREAESKLLEYRLIALKAQINPHFMSNCLSAIQHLIVSNKLQEATDYIAKFGYLVRQILNYSDKPEIFLSEEIQMAKLYMELEQLRFEKKFNYEITIHSEIDPDKVLIPALILNPILENAIWHGLLPVKNQRQGKVQICVKKKNERLLISISDNGAGRKKYPVFEGHISKGTSLIRERLKNLNLLNGTGESVIYFEDLKDNGESAGTVVSITLPLNLNVVGNA